MQLNIENRVRKYLKLIYMPKRRSYFTKINYSEVEEEISCGIIISLGI